MRVLGAILVVAGLLGLAVGTLQYTRTKTVLDIGPVQVQRSEPETVAIPPLFAAGVAAAGLLLFLTAKKK
jgi:hypothetical protein